MTRRSCAGAPTRSTTTRPGATSWCTRRREPLHLLRRLRSERPLRLHRALGSTEARPRLQRRAPFAAAAASDRCVPATDRREGGVTTIGSQDGITAMHNVFRDQWPDKTLLKKGADGKWPDLSTLTQPVDQWKAIDKHQRAEQILVHDHDQSGYQPPN